MAFAIGGTGSHECGRWLLTRPAITPTGTNPAHESSSFTDFEPQEIPMGTIVFLMALTLGALAFVNLA